jgi:hypothetical protein
MCISELIRFSVGSCITLWDIVRPFSKTGSSSMLSPWLLLCMGLHRHRVFGSYAPFSDDCEGDMMTRASV